MVYIPSHGVLWEGKQALLRCVGAFGFVVSGWTEQLKECYQIEGKTHEKKEKYTNRRPKLFIDVYFNEALRNTGGSV